MRHNTDIGACAKDSCPIKFRCLRWHLGTNKDPHQTWLIGGQNVATEKCKFFIDYCEMED